MHIRFRVGAGRACRERNLANAITHKYTGKPFPWRDREGRLAIVIEILKAKYSKLPFEHTPA